MGVPKLCCYYFIQSAMTVKVKVICSPKQMHGEDQAHHTEVMIAVKMGYQNMIDAVQVCLKTHELHLRTLPAIDKKKTVLDLDQL
jgi:hypothetical protein